MSDISVLVCGSRSIDDEEIVTQAIYGSPWTPSTIIHGGADGVDHHADQYALDYGISRDVHPVPDWAWEKVGKKAGPMRNGYMVEQADAVVAVWDGESPGTKDTMKKAESEGVPLYKVVCDQRDGEWVIEQEKHVQDDQASLGDF